MTKANFGVVGMAVMGRNLALNIESRGYTVAIYNRSKEKTEDVIACHPEKNFVPSYDVESFVNSIEKPRRIMLMVQAGPGTDATIQALLPQSVVMKNWQTLVSTLSVQEFLVVKKVPLKVLLSCLVDKKKLMNWLRMFLKKSQPKHQKMANHV